MGMSGIGFDAARYRRGIAAKHPPAVVVSVSECKGRLVGIANARVRPLRIPPGELSIIHLGADDDAIAGVGGNLQPVVNRVCGAGRNQPYVGDRARRPGIALVDGISMLVQQEAAVEVGARLHRTSPLVFDAAAVENDPSPVVHRLELDPHVERVDGPAGEEMPDLSRAHDDLEADRLAPPHGRIDAIERSQHVGRWRENGLRRAEIERLLAHGERAGRHGLSGGRPLTAAHLGSLPTHESEDVDRDLPIAEEVLHGLRAALHHD